MPRSGSLVEQKVKHERERSELAPLAGRDVDSGLARARPFGGDGSGSPLLRDPGFKVAHSSRNFCLYLSAAECPYSEHKDQSHLKVYNGALVRKDGQPLTTEI